MRFSYLLVLTLLLALGTTYWYESTKYICPAPVEYRLGKIDDSFSITEVEAKSSIEAAIALWENGTGVDLFVYDDQADLVISFVFDERQAAADAQESDQARLDAVSSQNDEIRSAIDDLQNTYENMQSAFKDRRAAYDQALVAYNDEVRQANDRGGATTDEFISFEETQKSLQIESGSLRTLAGELNNVAAQLNELSTEGNRLVRSYNREVNQYNDEYSEGEEFTQGDYTGEAINIYKFSSPTELVSVLAHEFGHALGIGHVEESNSLMYYLLTEDKEGDLKLSAADLRAYKSVCRVDSWDFKLRSIIRSIIS